MEKEKKKKKKKPTTFSRKLVSEKLREKTKKERKRKFLWFIGLVLLFSSDNIRS